MNHHLDPIFLRAFSLKASFLEEGRLRGWRKFHGSTCCFASSMTWTARGGLTFSGNLPIFWVKHELFQISNMIHVSSFGFFREFFCAFLGWTVPFFGGTFDSFFSNNPNHPTQTHPAFPVAFSPPCRVTFVTFRGNFPAPKWWQSWCWRNKERSHPRRSELGSKGWRLPSRELTNPPKMAFWRWFSFSPGGIC